jgi:hypothetical protein
LLHKGVVESAAYHHKKAVSAALMILFKSHYRSNPPDGIGFCPALQLAKVLWLRTPNLMHPLKGTLSREKVIL